MQDSKGTDLLNPQNTGHYKDSEITISGDVSLNAVSIQKYSPETDYYYLQLVLDCPKPDVNKGQDYEEELMTPIKFGNNQADEIKGIYKLKYHKGDDSGFGTGSGYTIILQQAWFNDKEIYEIQAAKETDWELPVVLKEPNNK